MRAKIIRTSTSGSSLNIFCKGFLQKLQEQYEIVVVASPDGGYLEELGSREGVRIKGVHMQRRISILNDLLSLMQLCRVFHKECPNMVHSMTPKAGLLCMIASWMTRVPVRAHTFTGLVWPTTRGMKRRILMLTDKITCACATHVIPEGYGVLEDLVAHITKKPLQVLGYGNIRGVDMVHYSLRTEVMALADRLRVEGTFTFVFVGRIVGDKGINELVSAFQRLLTQAEKKRSEKVNVNEVENKNKDERKQWSDFRLLLVGRFEDNLDPVSNETRALIELIPEIEAVGPQYGDELLAYYAAADCFVFPSYREGFPNTVMEAGAMEVASIVTDINGSSEIIINTGEKVPQHLGAGEKLSVRENGVMIPSKNVDALYDAMVWMMEHPDERKKMGKRAREIVAERWEQGFVREKLFEFYREVLGE